jgi:hypothetical protein
MSNKIQDRELIYGDWRDDIIALGIPLHMPDSKYASPECPTHGWISMRKKKINIWKCDRCKCEIILDEKTYRDWRNKNANNKYSLVPPIKGSHCSTYITPQNPKNMEGCAECMQNFGRCLVEMSLVKIENKRKSLMII